MGPKPKALEERFWGKVQKSDGCWNWTGKHDAFGYGRLWISDKPYVELQAHRFSYTIHIGEIPEGLSILHKCDNPPCVNPEHLFIGTRADNMVDKVQKGRQPRGIELPQHILTDDDVREIRRRYELRRRTTGVATRNDPNGAEALAKEYGVSKWAIFDCCNRRRWKHVE